MDAIDKTYPGPDYPDLMAAVDAAVAQGIADPDNLFVTGGSGGGVLTAWVVGKTNRFRAAAAQKPVINMASQVLTADGTPYFARYWFGKLPWEDPQGYWARSPLSLVGNVKTPTLVVVGSEDYRTPVSEASNIIPRFSSRACRPRWSRFPAHPTTSSGARRSRRPGPRRSLPGSTNIGSVEKGRHQRDLLFLPGVERSIRPRTLSRSAPA